MDGNDIIEISTDEATPNGSPSVLQADVQSQENNAADIDASVDTSILNTDTSDTSDSSSSSDTSTKQFQGVALQDRIGTAADCVLCKHAPICPYYQCAQGHLLCASCYATILCNAVDGIPRGKCPRCSALVIDSVINPVAEVLSNQLSKLCYYCGQYFLGHMIKNHYKICLKRLTKCPYSIIGCTWEGYRDQLNEHKNQCEKQNLTGSEALEFITSHPMEKPMKMKQDVENFLNEMPELNTCMIYKPPVSANLLADKHFFAGSFKAKDCKWLIDFVWRPKNEAFNDKSTISYRIKLLSSIEQDVEVKLQYFVVKGAYRDEIYNVQINSTTFTAERCVSPDSVFIIETAEYCERLLRTSGIYVRLCFT